MDVVFFGSGAFGLPTLQRLAERHAVKAVVTQPDRKAGRGGKLTPTPIGAWAAEHLGGTPLMKPDRVSAEGPREDVRAIGADAWVVIAYGQKLSQQLLADRFAINLHASLLPRWRGAAPINAAILAGDPETGNSVITLAERMDAGFVLGQSRRPLDPALTAGEVHDLLAEDGPDLVERVLADHAAGRVEMSAQDESLVTIAPKLSKADGWLDFRETAEQCRRRVHGLNPWPCVTVAHRHEPVKILRVGVADGDASATPGTILDATLGTVACAHGTAIIIQSIQPAGKKPMDWQAYANGRQVKAGEVLEGGRS